MSPERNQYIESKVAQLRKLPSYSSSRGSTVSTNDVLRLDSNENLFIPLELLKEVMTEAVRLTDPRQYPYRAKEDLVTSLAKYLDIEKEKIVVASGGDALIDIITSYFMTLEDVAILIEPTFSMYRNSLVTAGRKVKSVALADDFSLDVDSVLQSIKSGEEAIFVCSPNNPTGIQYSREDVCTLLESTEGLVVLDEAYADFAQSTLMGLVDTYENLFVLRTFSKGFGLAGLRIGYAVTDTPLADAIRQHVLPPYPTSSLSMQIAALAMGHLETVQQAIKETMATRGLLLKGLGTMNDVRVYPSDANFVLVKIPLSSKVFADRLLKMGIRVRVVDWIGDGADYVRITVPPRQNLSLVLDSFKEALLG